MAQWKIAGSGPAEEDGNVYASIEISTDTARDTDLLIEDQRRYVSELRECFSRLGITIHFNELHCTGQAPN